MNKFSWSQLSYPVRCEVCYDYNSDNSPRKVWIDAYRSGDWQHLLFAASVEDLEEQLPYLDYPRTEFNTARLIDANGRYVYCTEGEVNGFILAASYLAKRRELLNTEAKIEREKFSYIRRYRDTLITMGCFCVLTALVSLFLSMRGLVTAALIFGAFFNIVYWYGEKSKQQTEDYHREIRQDLIRKTSKAWVELYDEATRE